MKIFLSIIAIIFLATISRAANDTNGFLVFEIGRYAYSPENGKEISKSQQKFKLPLTREFYASFKKLPVPRNSMGTGLYCFCGPLKLAGSGTSFMWWIHKTTDHRWSINMWGEGGETTRGVKLQARPKVSQDLRIRNWEDIDMQYMLSYANESESVNVSFTAKFMKAGDMPAEQDLAAAPVRKADGSVLFQGDDLSKLPARIECGFQEN